MRDFRCTAILICAFILSSGCATPSADAPLEELTRELAGTTLVYRFEIGRVYRAAYSADTVDFRLIEPEQDDAPSATLPYRARRIRDGVYWVAWVGDPRFHTTLLIDLEKRQMHASALLGGERSFFETAHIQEITRAP